MEGSLGIIPKRVLVEEARLAAARSLLIAHGLEHELKTRA
jgi:hypothetical protein